MQNQNENDSGLIQKTSTHNYDITDLKKFENTKRFDSVGKMTESTKPTQPSYGFGTADRQKQGKIYQSPELSKTQFLGTTSQGPKYEVRGTDKYYYKQEPTHSFGKSVRNTLDTGAKHAFYNRKDDDFDPATADNSRRWGPGGVKIGLESRFSDTPKHKCTPGAEYNPVDQTSSLKYSFGVRREVKGQSPVAPIGSTTKEIGPGSYLKMDQATTSLQVDNPRFSFPKATRDDKLPSVQKNVTYDTSSSLGNQVASTKKSAMKASIGKAKRDNPAGVFKSAMSNPPVRLNIPMPRF